MTVLMRRNQDYMDRIISEAVKRELDAIEPPPAGPVWEKIRAGLDRPGNIPAASTPRRAWVGAAIAASFLLVAWGSWGIYQSLKPADAGDRAALSFTGERAGEEMAPVDSLAVDEIDDLPDWPEIQRSQQDTVFSRLPQYIREYQLSRVMQGETSRGIPLMAAIYSSNGLKILWVNAETDLVLEQFIQELGSTLAVKVSILESDDQALYFSDSHARNGVARSTAASHYVIWDLSGTLSTEDLPLP